MKAYRKQLGHQLGGAGENWVALRGVKKLGDQNCSEQDIKKICAKKWKCRMLVLVDLYGRLHQVIYLPHPGANDRRW